MVGQQSPIVAGAFFNPPMAGFFVALTDAKGSDMDTLHWQLLKLLRFLGDDGFTVSILSVVVVVCFLAFGLGAAYELVGGMLILGLITAVVEARMHTKNRR
jgi:hypothetical protein